MSAFLRSKGISFFFFQKTVKFSNFLDIDLHCHRFDKIFLYGCSRIKGSKQHHIFRICTKFIILILQFKVGDSVGIL